jgi:hypothetical protein
MGQSTAPRTLTVIAPGLLAGLLVAGCGGGSVQDSDPMTQSRSVPTESGTGSGTQTDSAALFPMTLTRTGGVAGFSGSVTVAGDGRATADGPGAGEDCKLEAATLGELTSLAGSGPPTSGTATSSAATSTTAPTTPTATMADELVVVVESPRGTVRLTEEQLSGPGSVITQLFDDLGKPPGERTLCR